MIIAAVFAGLVAGAALGALLAWLYLRPQLQSAESLGQKAAALAEQMLRTSLSEGREQTVQLATQELSGKQQLIDQRLGTLQSEVTGKLEKVTTLVAELEKTRHAAFATLSTQLERNAQHLGTLQQTTSDLKAALSNSRTRGQWGERMAEDVLQLAGLKENIQYRKQQTLSGENGSRPRPDFTFLMPENRVLHMDVKFPMDNYLAYLNAESEPARQQALRAFLQDVRNRIRETSAREYRSAAASGGESTLEYILIFIPNEQIYGFLMEQDATLFSQAVASKVILCSPTTLLAVLAVIHQASQHFALEKKGAEVFALLKTIQQQWDKFTDEMTKMGRKIDEAQNAFGELAGTRSRMLDRQFAKLQSLPQAEESAPQPSLLGSTAAANPQAFKN